MFLTVVTVFFIGYSGWGNLFPLYSPNLKSPFPESLGNSWGIVSCGKYITYGSCNRNANHVFVKEIS